MSAIHIEASQHINQPASTVFALLRDSEALGKAAGIPMTCLVDGPEPGGAGTVRRVGPPWVGPEETILELVPDQLVRYRISRNGGPIRHHEARMELRPATQGSVLTWSMDFQVPMALALPIRATLPRVAKFALKRIAKTLEPRA